jgi:hypothetical protein
MYGELVEEHVDDGEILDDERVEDGHVGLLAPELDSVGQVLEDLGDHHQPTPHPRRYLACKNGDAHKCRVRHYTHTTHRHTRHTRRTLD